jgi:hypothetical protein
MRRFIRWLWRVAVLMLLIDVALIAAVGWDEFIGDDWWISVPSAIILVAFWDGVMLLGKRRARRSPQDLE